jgi:hypothetical protein
MVIREIEKGAKAVDEGRLIDHVNIKAKRETTITTPKV